MRGVMLGLGLLAVGAGLLSAGATSDFTNDKVAVREVRLAPGEHLGFAGNRESVVVYLAGDEAQIKFGSGLMTHESIARGRVVRLEDAVLTNTGHQPLRLVQVEFLTGGSSEIWGRTGLPSSYEMLFEDNLNRTYVIRVAAHEWEPMHSHHARVVVCLDGSTIEHIRPDGSTRTATLKTDSVSWRLAETHKAHNVGDSDLWVVAIEPKG